MRTPQCEPNRSDGASRGAPRPSVLAIDDDRDSRALIQRILDRHVVIEACDGRAGLRAYATAPRAPLVAIVDVLMPEVDGLETIKALKSLPAPPRIIAISAGGRTHDSGFLELARALGADACLPKPFDFDDLRRLVDQLSREASDQRVAAGA